ncbi:unnamed protein product [Staurois parvus]|uniref:Uncharacterized protein n=1 Tax=Staurois parvus TaxID=386267 RepID=A0ABN9BFY6_9NEOB|nr:unnamed protein product [Staurois parvus]
MRSPWRADIGNAVSVESENIVNVESKESAYTECQFWEERISVNASSGESAYSECGVQGSGYSECGCPGRADIVNARVQGERIILNSWVWGEADHSD